MRDYLIYSLDLFLLELKLLFIYSDLDHCPPTYLPTYPSFVPLPALVLFFLQRADAFVQYVWTLCEDEAAGPEVLHAEGHSGGVPLHEGAGPLQYQWVCSDSVLKDIRMSSQQLKYGCSRAQPYFREAMGGLLSERVTVVFWLCGCSASGGSEEPAMFWWTANLLHQGAGPLS